MSNLQCRKKWKIYNAKKWNLIFTKLKIWVLSLEPILSQHNPNNWLYIGRWSIAKMLHQYTIIVCPYEAMSQVPVASQLKSNISQQDIANANIANQNPIWANVAWQENPQQYANVGPIHSCCQGKTSFKVLQTYLTWRNQVSLALQGWNR